jgi:hypothetical protein
MISGSGNPPELITGSQSDGHTESTSRMPAVTRYARSAFRGFGVRFRTPGMDDHHGLGSDLRRASHTGRVNSLISFPGVRPVMEDMRAS